MSRFDASNPDSELILCAVCEKSIRGASWCARIEHNHLMFALCCPLCVQAFTSKPNAYVRRIETLNWIENHPPAPPEYSPLND